MQYNRDEIARMLQQLTRDFLVDQNITPEELRAQLITLADRCASDGAVPDADPAAASTDKKDIPPWVKQDMSRAAATSLTYGPAAGAQYARDAAALQRLGMRGMDPRAARLMGLLPPEEPQSDGGIHYMGAGK
jgi:hypothetical protein